jgi:hypothetical protein
MHGFILNGSSKGSCQCFCGDAKKIRMLPGRGATKAAVNGLRKKMFWKLDKDA